MMNHHPMSPYGQPPTYPPRRQHDMPYSPIPPNMRHQPYPGYYPPHMGGPMPPYPPQHYQQNWYSYQHMHPQMPPPRQYPHPQMHPQQHPYQPLVVSSYPMSQPQQAPAPIPPTNIPLQLSPQSMQLPNRPLDKPISPPPPSTPSSINNVQDTPPASSAGSNVSESASITVSTPEPTLKAPFEPPLPWLSVADQPFPPRTRRRRRRMPSPQSDSEPVQFLFRQQIQESEVAEPSGKARDTDEVKSATRAQTGPLPSDDGTPQTSVAPSENDSTQPTTPSSAIPGTEPRTQQTPTQPKNGRSFAPAVPVIPAMPTSPATPRRRHRDSVASVTSKPPSSIHAQTAAPVPEHGNTDATASVTSPASEETSKATSPRPPKSWADLVRSKAPGPSQSTLNAADIVPATGTLKPDSLADVLTTMSSNAALHPTKLSFLEPKGLVNTGNMCYMNSILQILTFCVPFYEFLDRLSRDAVHSLKSDTPLIDAMILFMKEYRVIDSATSAEKLRLRLRQEEVEQYGDAFIPENVYEVIRTLPRFRDMRRGHQQDAQEFLGFLLEELHEECAFSLKKAMTAASEQTNSTASEDGASRQDEDGWMEVGVKQKASTTRASGVIGAESPITKIFGGKLRSELRIPGVRQSNTVEPFESLQLDIGSPQINNIIDALKGLSKPEAIPGEFNSPRGKVNATKQVYIEQLPPVLILHLKRFQYDNATKRTEKIWKKIGYPLNLEIPREAFPVQVRNKMLHHGGIPQYRLTGVIYHHGRNASGGHYTVDVRRQDGIEWIRLDDTVIRRVRAEDVAGGGGEEDLKVLAEALERHNEQAKLSTNGNIYDSIHEGNDDEDASDKGWSQVNGTTGAHSRVKSTASAVNGVSSPAIKDSSGRHTPSHKNASAGVKDNKVAYLLFYQKVGGIA